MKHFTLLFFAVLFALSFFPAPETDAQTLDPLETRWTFGNHEPIQMYRRIGRRSTGGIEGSAQWLADWHHWYDSEACPAQMEALGLNMIHSRFYKGLGWQYESQDFPNVQKFVANCHKHHVRVLAYVQYMTLYYEVMKDEIPDLETWAAIDENGKRAFYGSTDYFRWLPCEGNPKFEENLKKVIRIALTDGGFDGLMFDNAWGERCYCERCTKAFREYLEKKCDPFGRLGIPSFRHIEIPQRAKFGEIQDPLYQEWLLFRTERHSALFQRLTAYARSIKPDAIVTANTWDIRNPNLAWRDSYDIPEMTRDFTFLLSQDPNAPRVLNGGIINRVRELKLGQALGKPVLALCDQDAGIQTEDQYLLPLWEDAVFGGIPTDRTIMKPDREHFVSPEVIAFRKPLLERFNQEIRENRPAFAAPTWNPVRVLISRESQFFSEAAFLGLFAAEEVLLRNHVPYGLLLTSAKDPMQIPEDCELLVVPDQRCLSEAEIDRLAAWAKGGGKLFLSGPVGDYDELYRQRRENRLLREVKDLPNVVYRADADQSPGRMNTKGWEEWVKKDGGKRLIADVRTLWTPPVELDLPQTVFTEWKRDGDRLYIHFVNYLPETVQAEGVGEFREHALRVVELPTR